LVGNTFLQQTQDFNIRYVKEKDRQYLIPKIKNVIGKFTQDIHEETINTLIDKALENKDFSGIVLVDPEDTPRGYVFCTITELYFSPVKVSCCLSLWVDEDCRTHSLDMIRAFESWSKYKQANKMMFSTFKGVSPKGLDKVFTRFGYEVQEVQYWKDTK